MNIGADHEGTSFSVTVGPAPDLFWFRTSRPPRLGQKVRVVGKVLQREKIGQGRTEGSVTQLSATDVAIFEDERPTRLVPQSLIQRCQSMMRRPLLSFQAEGAGWMAMRLANRVGAILGDDPGIGKTTQAIAAVCAIQTFPAVVVCPASVKEHWRREFRLAAGAPRVSIISGQQGPLVRSDVYVINYALLRYREDQLRQLTARLYILDEAQELKHPRAVGKHRAAVATRLVRPTGGALELTGTPVMNRPAELWRLLHLADPKKWPSYAQYAGRYLEGVKGKEVGRSVRTTAGKVERLDELHAAVGPFMLRRLKRQVLKHLPAKSYRTALVRIGHSEMQHYRAAERDVVKWLHHMGQSQRALNARNAESIVKLNLLRRIAAIGKLRQAIPEYLASWFSRRRREPLVIFGYHKDVIRGLWGITRKMGLRVAGIGGGEGTDKRQRQVDRFQAGEADVFVAPIMTAGVGLNLQRACHALFVERIWTPSGMIQAEDRIWRLGQKRPVTITYMDAADTVDEHVASVLEAKQRLINAVVGDDYTSESLQVVAEVTELMRAS